MLSLADRDYNFKWGDVDKNGANSAIFNQRQLHEYIVTNHLGFSVLETVMPGDSAIKYFFLGDDDFALKRSLMMPYSHQNMNIPKWVFNYRLS